MKLVFTHRAERDYDALSTKLQVLVDKQFDYLVTGIRHPSLRAKKYDEGRGVWQGRVDRNYRFYFVIVNNTYVILAITKHPK